ncbi:MAG TPA: hypothetical protein VFX52_04800 [Nocardioidaceae bacterium]|jgi:hypothetical protein|nr:hypothetical protein [Nocardioidaceae bacterium]
MPSLAPLVALAAESSKPAGNPYFYGGGVLLILVLVIAGLLNVGRGRDHS